MNGFRLRFLAVKILVLTLILATPKFGAAVSKKEPAARKAPSAKAALSKTKSKKSKAKKIANQLALTTNKDTTTINSADTEKLNAVLAFVAENVAQKHGWPANYKTLWCPTNIFNLLRRLEQVRVDLSTADVWYIMPESQISKTGESLVRPKAARRANAGDSTDWTFHVVLEIEGQILDLDFTEAPHATPKLEYAAKMWSAGRLANSARAQPLFVRVIPAKDYLSSYYGNWSWYLEGGSGVYQAIDFESLLSRP